MSAWLTTRLDDYEGHVELDTVGQAPAIRAMLRELIRRHAPASFLYLGCAGGNGLECVEGSGIQRTVAVDLNPAFLDAARKRSAAAHAAANDAKTRAAEARKRWEAAADALEKMRAPAKP